MALTTKSRLEQIALVVARELRDYPLIEEAWAQFDEDQYQVLVLVDSDDLSVEKRVRAIYADLMAAFPSQEIDLYVTSTVRTPQAAWRALVAPDARKIEV